ncbi:MAG: aspartyl protease family protein [Hyphomonadaceae bacterium]
MAGLHVNRRALIAGGASLAVLKPEAWGQDLTSLPMETNETGHFIVSVTINGDPVRAILDNGSMAMMVDTSYAEEKGLTASGKTPWGGGIRLEGTFKMKMGWLDANIEKPLLLDMSSILSEQGPVRLMIGRPLLDRLATVYSSAGKRFTILPPDVKFEILGDHVTLPITLQADHHVVDASIENGPPIKALVDLGCSNALVIRRSAATDRWISEGRSWTTQASYKMGDGRLVLSEDKLLTVRSISLGQFELKNLPAQLVAKDGGPFSDYDLTIGAPALARFTVTLDGPRMQLHLKPDNRVFTNPFEKTYVGISSEEHPKGRRIVHIGANSPAMAAGLKAGDVVVAVNGRPPDKRVFRDAKAGDVLMVSVDTGAVRTVMAADFF